jgi:hypothetical protein
MPSDGACLQGATGAQHVVAPYLGRMMNDRRAETEAFAAGRLMAHRSLDRLFDEVRATGTRFGRARLEVVFEHGAPVRRVAAIERSERDGE